MVSIILKKVNTAVKNVLYLTYSPIFHLYYFSPNQKKIQDENENENENSESKQSEQNSLDNNSNTDDEQKRANSGNRSSSNSNNNNNSNDLEIKRERNENCSTKIDRNDGECNTVNNGKLMNTLL